MTDQTPVAQTPAAAPAQAPAQAATPVEQHAASQSSPQTGTAAASPTQPAQPASPASKPDWLPDAFWDKEKVSVKGDEFKSRWTTLEKAEADLTASRGDTPAKAEDYKAVLNEDFKLPEGLSIPPGYEFNQQDPLFIAFRKLANETGMSQKQFSAALGIEATRGALNQKLIAARDQALGENAAARLSDLGTWFDASFDKVTAAHFKGNLFSPEIVRGLETMKKALTSQGVGSFTASGREAPDVNDGKPDGWDRFSNIDKRTWFIQQQREEARGRH